MSKLPSPFMSFPWSTHSEFFKSHIPCVRMFVGLLFFPLVRLTAVWKKKMLFVNVAVIALMIATASAIDSLDLEFRWDTLWYEK